MSGLRKVNPGDVLEIDSSTFNAFIDAANANQAGRQSRPGQLIRQPTYPCLNVSTTDSERFQPLKIMGTIIDPADNEIQFNARVGFRVEPIESIADIKSIVISQAPIKAGKIGPGIVLGVTPATVNIIDELHTHATPNIDGGFDSSDQGPALILWQEPGLGPKRAVVSLIQSEVGASRFFARITGSSEESPNRWLYDFELVTTDAAGVWTTLLDSEDQPRTSATLGPARNTLEAGNASDGVQGNGVDTANLSGSFAIVPIGGGSIVELRGPLAADIEVGETGYWAFTVANLVDGSC